MPDSSQLVYGIATRGWEKWTECVNSWLANTEPRVYHVRVVLGMLIMPAFEIVREETHEPIIAYIHDDVMIYEKDWDLRVLKEFEDPTVGMVGFGGALRHGSPDLYKGSYVLHHLGRAQFLSNMRNAEDHGKRFTGECDVAVLDGFALFIRREILDRAGGWPQDSPINYFCYDHWISCIVRRQGYRIRLVGVDCHHLSGKTASMIALPDDHARAHWAIYEEFQDVLPYAVEGA